MLLTAVSRRCFSSVSRCCDARCCCDSLRTTRNSRPAIASTDRPATAIRIPICSRQSASAAETVVVATIDDRKIVQRARRRSAGPCRRSGWSARVVAVVGFRQTCCWLSRTGPEILPDHLLDMRDSARAACRRGGASKSPRLSPSATRGEELLEIGRLDAAADDAEEFAVAAR